MVAALAVGGLAAQPAAAGAAPAESISVSSLPSDYATGYNWNLSASACGSSESCVTVGSYEFVGPPQSQSHSLIVPIYDGVAGPGIAAPVPSNHDTGTTENDVLDAVACWSGQSCVAVGNYADANQATQAFVVPITNGVPGPAVEAVLPGDQAADPKAALFGVACSSSGSCVAVGNYRNSSGATSGLVLPIDDGVPGTGSEVAAPASTATTAYAELDDVSCQSGGSCVAVGWYYNDPGADYSAMVVPISDGTPAAAQTGSVPGDAISYQDAWLPYVSCPSSGPCDAIGYYDAASANEHNVVVPITGGSQGQPAVPAPPAGSSDGYVDFTGIACQPDGACVASGSYPDGASNTEPALTAITDGVPSDSVGVVLPDGAATGTGLQDAQLNAIDCPVTGPCLGTGFYRDANGNLAGMTVEVDAGAPGDAVASAPSDVSTTSPYSEYDAVACAVFSCVASGRYTNTGGNDLPFVLSAQGQLAIAATSLPGGAIGSAYSQTLSASGAWGVYSWTVSSGTLPAGLSLNSASGVISGMPTAPGTSTFTVQATGTGSPAQTATESLSLTITAPPAPPAAPAASPKLSLLGSSALVHRNRFGLRLRCKAAPCKGTAKLQITERYTVKRGKKRVHRHRSVVIARAHFDLAAGQTRTLRVALDAAGRKALAALHRLHATVTDTMGGVKHTAGHLTLKAPPAKKKKH